MPFLRRGKLWLLRWLLGVKKNQCVVLTLNGFDGKVDVLTVLANPSEAIKVKMQWVEVGDVRHVYQNEPFMVGER